MSIIAASDVQRLVLHCDHNLTSTQIAILRACADYVNNETLEFWPSYATLAKVTMFNVRTIKRIILQFEEMGLLAITRRFVSGKQTSNKYHWRVHHHIHIKKDEVIEETTPVQDSIIGDPVPTRGVPENTRGDLKPPKPVIDPVKSNKELKGQQVVQDKNSDFDSQFEKLWREWPRKVKKDRAKKRLRAILSDSKSRDGQTVAEFLEMLHSDILERVKANEFGFAKTHFATYLSERGWTDVIAEPEKPVDNLAQQMNKLNRRFSSPKPISENPKEYIQDHIGRYVPKHLINASKVKDGQQ